MNSKNPTPEEEARLLQKLLTTRTALIDMDGVLYDSMKYHTLAWQQTITELGIACTREEFFLYEGMTGAATIDLIWQRTYNRPCPPERIKEIYSRKSNIFEQQGVKEPMPGADRMLCTLREAGIKRVLVTGSSQQSILSSISADYPEAFAPGMRVTAADVVNGKPDPEPYLKGLSLAGSSPEEAIVIENAPLGVRAGKAAGCYTIAVTTGPIPRKAFEKENADIIFADMPSFADALSRLLNTL